MQLADQVLLDFPDRPEGLYIRGLIVSRFGDSREAVRCWRECLRMVPEFADPHFWIGWDAMRRGQYDQAITEFQQALELQPELPDVRLRLGESLIHAGRLPEAIEILKQQIRFEPNRYEGHFRLGEAYFHNKQIPEAITAYEQAVKLDPDNTFAWFGLSKSYRRLGQTERAREYLEQFQSRKAQQTKLARSEKVAYDDLSELRTGLANAYFAAARVYDLADRPDRAKACLEKATALDPTNKTYRHFQQPTERQ